jgi:hypothetical protein
MAITTALSPDRMMLIQTILTRPIQKQRLQQLGHLRRVARDLEAALLHDRQLGIGGVGAAGDQRAGMAHALAGGAVTPAMKPDDRLLHVVLAPARGFGLVGAADLADHDDGVGFRIVVEGLHHVDVLQAVDRVAADADRAGLAQADLGELRHGFIGERAGARDDADAALAVDVAGHDADLDLVGRDQAGAVGAQQQRLLAALGFLGLHLVAHFQHVAHRDAFGDADRQVQVGFDGFPDRRGGARGRHVDHGHGGAGLLLGGFLHRGEDRDVEDLLAGLLRVHARHEAVLAVRVFLALLGVELAGLARDALGDDPGVLVDVDRHDFSSLGLLDRGDNLLRRFRHGVRADDRQARLGQHLLAQTPRWCPSCARPAARSGSRPCRR